MGGGERKGKAYLMGYDKDEHGRILAGSDQVWASDDVLGELDSWQVPESSEGEKRMKGFG